MKHQPSTISESRDKVALFLKNWFSEPSRTKVLGAVLGNCIFNKNSHVSGKFFKGVFRNLAGEKVAMLHHDAKKDLQQKKIPELMNQAWDIISNI